MSADLDDTCPECHADWKRPDPECSRCGPLVPRTWPANDILHPDRPKGSA